MKPIHMPYIRLDYNQARARYGDTIANAIWHNLTDRNGKRDNTRIALVIQPEDTILAKKPKAERVRPTIADIVARS